ncbi:MAG: ADP compounds hydrolase NudE [Francisellaceae bacterium]
MTIDKKAVIFMNAPPIINDRRELARSRLFKIEEIELTFSNGNKRIYECVGPTAIMHRAVLIVPLLDDDTIILVKEYSVGIEDYTLSFPKGSLFADEDLFEAADRELMEEVGYTAKNYTFLKDVYLSPNYMKHHISIVKAENLSPKRLDGDEPEPLEVVSYKLKDIDHLIEHPAFIECRSFAALFLIWRQWIGSE